MNRWLLVLALVACDAEPSSTGGGSTDTAVDAPIADAAVDAPGSDVPGADSAGLPDAAIPADALVSDSAQAADVADVYVPPTATLTGWAFAFAGKGKPIEGAVIRIAELPDLETTSAADGTWSLEVPTEAPVTPYAEAKGFALMHLQTFTLTGDLDHVNFQMVENAIFTMFAYALETEVDPERCQISTTANTIEVRDLDLGDFVAYGAHGVAGATAHADPPIADTVYFDELTIPDRTLTETTVDGGVVWANVPPGVYTITAKHPTRHFAPFVATCVPGRFINAGPTRGLREITAAEAGL